MLNKEKKRIEILLCAGVFLLGLFFFSIASTTLLFFVKIPISVINIFLSAVLSILVCYFISEKSFKITLIGSLIGIITVITAVFLCFLAYDWSWDGNAYHKPMAAFLKSGWNPIYTTFYDFADLKFPFLSNYDSNYLDAYPKGSEIFAACIYAVTNNIESAKCINIIVIVATFLITYAMLSEIKAFKEWQCLICAFVFSLNPIVLSQMFTYYIDGTMWHIILLCAFACLYLTFFKGQKYTKLSNYLIFITINIGFNLKFSAIIFLALLCGSLFLYWSIKLIIDKNFKQEKPTLLKRFYLLAISVISGTCFTGATSYVINFFRHRNPLYSIFGEGANEIINILMPASYQNRSNLYRFVNSIFSKTGFTEIKFPLSISANEIHYAKGYDTNVAGWGIFLSAILVVSLIVLIYSYFDYRKRDKSICNVALLLLIIQVLSIIFVPGLSWARYYAVPLYIPACAIVYLFSKSNASNKSSLSIFFAGILSALIICNMSPNITKSYDLLKEYKETKTKFDILISEYKTNKILISVREPYFNYNFYGRIFTLYDNGIDDFIYEPNLSDDSNASLVLNVYPIYYKTLE